MTIAPMTDGRVGHIPGNPRQPLSLPNVTSIRWRGERLFQQTDGCLSALRCLLRSWCNPVRGRVRERGKDTIKCTQAAPAHERLYKALAGPYTVSVSPQRRPLRMTKTIPLITQRSSTRGTPCDNGKNGSMRRSWRSDNQNRSLMTELLP